MTVPSVVRLRTYSDNRPPLPASDPFGITRLSWNAPRGKVFVAIVLGIEDADGSDPLPVVAMLRALVIDGVPVVPDATPAEAAS